jgi:hypothetical protein
LGLGLGLELFFGWGLIVVLLLLGWNDLSVVVCFIFVDDDVVYDFVVDVLGYEVGMVGCDYCYFLPFLSSRRKRRTRWYMDIPHHVPVVRRA